MQVTQNATQTQGINILHRFTGTDGLYYVRCESHPNSAFVYATKEAAESDPYGYSALSNRPTEAINRGTIRWEAALTKLPPPEPEMGQAEPTDEEKTKYYEVNISDFDPDHFEQITQEEPEQENEPEREGKNKQDPKEHKNGLLGQLLAIAEDLNERATKEVIYSPPLITKNEQHIVGRSTIVTIQGSEGAHKSRLAETFLSLFLSQPNADKAAFLGFEMPKLERFCGVYGDSERNLKEEFPGAIQAIKRLAGFNRDEKPSQFFPFSVKPIERKKRLPAVKDFLTHVRSQTDLHLIGVLDVTTDFVASFNDEGESMSLFDYLGNLCDSHDCTFILVIHVNPGSEKARGHVGTEAANKSATVLQIGLEQDARGNETGLIKVRFKKIRRGPKPDPLYLVFDKEKHRLALASEAAVSDHMKARQQVADVEDVGDKVADLLSDGPKEKGDVWLALQEHFGAGQRTIRNRLKDVLETCPEMYDRNGKAVRLVEYSEPPKHFYKLDAV